MKTLEALLELLPLDHLARTGWVLRGAPQAESIAGHILGSCYLALGLGTQIDPPLAMDRVLAQILVHDAPEARSGDIPRPAAQHLPQGAKEAMEGAIAQELLGPLGSSAMEAWEEFQAGETREARFARLCERLQLGVQLTALYRQGQAKLVEFEAGLRSLDCREFPVAEELLHDILDGLDQP